MLVAKTQTQETASWMLIEFWASQEFKNEIAEGSTIAYRVGFEDYKRALSCLQPKLDSRGLQPDEEDKALESDEEADDPEEHPGALCISFHFF